MVTEVHREEEILLADQTTELRLHIVGPVQGPALLTPFAAKVTLGEYSRDDEPLASTLSLEAWQGGLGLRDADQERTFDRFYFATLDTRFERVLFPLPLAVPATTAAPLSMTPRTSAQYYDRLYVAFDHVLYYWGEVTHSWLQPPTTPTLTSIGTDATTVRLGATDWLVFADGAGVLRFDGAVWTYAYGNSTTVPLAKWLCEWDEKLWCLDVNNRLWQTTNLTTWVGGATIAQVAGEAQGLYVYFNADNVATLVAPTHDGLWTYDATAEKWYRTRLRFPRHAFGGAGACDWRGDFYLSAGLSVYRYTGSTVSPAGLDRDSGLPTDFLGANYRGNIVRLRDLFNWVVAGVDATTVAEVPELFGGAGDFDVPQSATLEGSAAIFAYSGTGWHTLWVNEAISTGLNWLAYHTNDGRPRLWWNSGVTPYYQDVPSGIFNPRELPTWQFAPSGELHSTWFNAAWPEQDKLAIDLTVQLEHGSATATVAVYYGIDGDPAWIWLGTLDSDVQTILPFNDGYGTAHRSIRLRFVFATGPDPTAAPHLDYAVLKFVRRPPARYGYVVQVDASADYSDRSPGQQIAALIDLAERNSLLTLQYRTAVGELVSRKVLVTQDAGGTWPGVDDRGRFRLALAEI